MPCYRACGYISRMLDRSALTTGALVRAACRQGRWTGPTAGLAAGYVQANLVALPTRWADEFREFCRENPRSCPLLEATEPGNPAPVRLAAEADLRTDLPRYRIWRNGELAEEAGDVRSVWRDDLVSFLIGCSFTFEAALLRGGVPIRHIELDVNVPMYRTRQPCRPAGVFHGPLVVSMRPIKRTDVARAIEITSRYPGSHGAPVHAGDPGDLGIDDLSRPDYGQPVPIGDDEVPVFWACGVTPQAALEQARLPLAITHSPGCMFVTDLRDGEAGK